MSLSLFFCGTAVFIQLVLGSLVLLRDPKKRANQVFSLQLFLFMIWNLAEINLLINGISLTGIKLLMTPGILLSYFFCIFSAIYPEYQKGSQIIRSRLSISLFFLPAAALIALLWSDRLIESFSAIHNGFTLSLGKFEFLVKGCIIGYLAYSLSTLSNSRKNAETEIQMRRLRYTFTAMLLPIAAGSIIIAAGKWFIGGHTAYSFGLFPVLSIVMSSILSYTMLMYNLMEIDLIFSIGLVYTLLTGILAGCMELMQELMQNLLNLSGMWAKIVSVLVIAAFFSPLKDLLIQLVDQFFGRKNFDSAKVMQYILAEMRRSQNIERMFKRMVQELKLVLDFSFCHIKLDEFPTIRLSEKDAEVDFPVTDFSGVPEDMNDIETAAEYFRSLGEEERASSILRLKESGIRNFFVIRSDEKNYGLMLLGAKTTKVPYTELELNLVSGICNEAPHLIENLRMIDRLLKQDRSSQEIEWARKMLNAISATENNLEIGSLQIATFSSLSSEIKGDLIDFSNSETNTFLGLYDAFHHGIQAVLTLNILFSVFRAENGVKEKFLRANEVLQHFKGQSLCSAATLVTVNNRVVNLANAGNPSPVLVASDGVRELIVEKTQPIGLCETMECSQISFALEEGQLMVLATNGLHKVFEQVAKVPLLKFLAEEKFVSAQDCKEKIIEKLGHRATTGFSDDITFVIAG